MRRFVLLLLVLAFAGSSWADKCLLQCGKCGKSARFFSCPQGMCAAPSCEHKAKDLKKVEGGVCRPGAKIHKVEAPRETATVPGHLRLQDQYPEAYSASCDPTVYVAPIEVSPFYDPLREKKKEFTNMEAADVFLAIRDADDNLISVAKDREGQRWLYPAGCLQRYLLDEAGATLGPHGLGEDSRRVPWPPMGGDYVLLARIDQSGGIDTASSAGGNVKTCRDKFGNGWRIIRSLGQAVNTESPNSGDSR